MKRLGLFTGKIYEGTNDEALNTECCYQLSDEQAANDSFVALLRAKSAEKCTRCKGCLAAGAH